MTESRTRALLPTALSRWWIILALTLLSSPIRAQEPFVNDGVAYREISLTSLRAIFTMHLRQWPDGKPIKVFVLPDQNDVHISFSKEVLKTFPYQLKRSWDLLVFSGSGQAPTVVESPKEMLQKLSSTPGSIGYLPKDYSKEGGKNASIHMLEVN